MPRFNGTGPNGQGPLTGRGFGPCGQGLGTGRGFGRGYGRGYGRGFGGGYNAPITEQQEKEMLTGNMNALQEELEAMKKRIKELGSEK